MGRKGNIGWGISNYFGLPNRKRKLLTKEFLQTFKEEIIKIDSESNLKYNRPSVDYENETYYSFYGQIGGTGLFYKSLKVACQKHNLTKAIYTYAKKLPWYDSDWFDDDLVLEMVNKGVIEKDNDSLKWDDYNNEDETAKYKLVKHFKGYDVVKYGTWFDDSRKDLEDIYNDGDWELWWMN